MDRITINIKNGYVEIEGMDKIKLSDILLNINCNQFTEISRADYLFEQLKDYRNYPNKIALHRKLNRFKK
jgi:hypothetical protein